MRGLKAQSAMEYLMTYGWAILIIAVVLGALFQLGVFNPNTFAPKAHAGACQVIRPYGPGNTNYISLAGACNNQLPEYVVQFGGVNSNILVQNSGALNFINAFSMVAWVNPYVVNTYNEYIIGSQTPSLKWKLGLTSTSQLRADLYNSGGADFGAAYSTVTFSTNTWYQVAVTFNGITTSLWVNGVNAGNGAAANSLTVGTTNPLIIGQDGNLPTRVFDGMMSNVQLYNSSLSANDIAALYQEGIGGAPIDLFSLVGWWPLNGNANDYSGNLNNGAASNRISYTASWTSSYNPP